MGRFPSLGVCPCLVLTERVALKRRWWVRISLSYHIPEMRRTAAVGDITGGKMVFRTNTVSGSGSVRGIPSAVGPLGLCLSADKALLGPLKLPLADFDIDW